MRFTIVPLVAALACGASAQLYPAGNSTTVFVTATGTAVGTTLSSTAAATATSSTAPLFTGAADSLAGSSLGFVAAAAGVLYML
ncbi:hypothetical protein NA57DRAFT_76368 [Rhizodiscina lignyota]|uniref:Uncharacterized protein n=1 Tax=Rhizodiscina lignyota TaxID=1504668 RepID=A0A9P4IH14_9PEZI|nr:hypothetical protein NA57DRAFT_76368 [Rhizodiscina lignyota]